MPKPGLYWIIIVHQISWNSRPFWRNRDHHVTRTNGTWPKSLDPATNTFLFDYQHLPKIAEIPWLGTNHVSKPHCNLTSWSNKPTLSTQGEEWNMKILGKKCNVTTFLLMISHLFCRERMIIGLGGGWTNPFEKYELVKLGDISPIYRGENRKYLKPPPRGIFEINIPLRCPAPQILPALPSWVAIGQTIFGDSHFT